MLNNTSNSSSFSNSNSSSIQSRENFFLENVLSDDLNSPIHFQPDFDPDENRTLQSNEDSIFSNDVALKRGSFFSHFFGRSRMRIFSKGISFLPLELATSRKTHEKNSPNPKVEAFLLDGAEVLKGRIRVSFGGSIWTKSIALQMILVFLFEFALLPLFEFESLLADPFDQNFESKNKAKGRLESYYNAAEKAKDATEWQTIIDSGKRILGAEWEANANVEIDKALKNFTGTSAAKQEELKKLQDQKKVASDKWEADLSSEMLEKRGGWKANLKKQDFDAYFTTEKKKEIHTALENLVKAANAAKDSATGDASARLSAWDSTINAGISGVRALWEDQISQIKTNALNSFSALSGPEKTEIEKKISEIESYYKNYFSLEESGVKLPARQNLILGLNTEMDIAIAQETDPTKVTELLIEKTRQQLDPATGALLNSLDDLGTIPTSYENVSGNNAQEKILKALQDGQALWDQAIERLIVKKLEYDRQAEDKRVRNEEQWSKAYYALLDAQSKWGKEVNKQIEDGLKKWDDSEAKLKENKTKALAELNQYLSTSQEQYLAHLTGLQGMILGSADTVKSIVSNINWYQEMITKENSKTTKDPALIATYQAEINKWKALETQFRTYVANVQNKIHDEDMQGNNGGSGVLNNNGNSSDPYLYSSAEFEYRLSKAQLDELEKKKNRAAAVLALAEQNVNTVNSASLATELAAAKAAYEAEQQNYLTLLQALNGNTPPVTGSTGMDGNSGSTTPTSSTPASTQLSQLEAAKKAAAEKQQALTLAQSDLDNARKRFEEAKQLQILLNNSSSDFLGEAGYVGESGTYDPNNPNRGIKYEIYQADLQIAEAKQKLNDNEKVFFSKNYNKANAARSELFFGDIWNRVQSFETSKEKLSILEKALFDSSNPDLTVIQKVNELLKPANTVLVTVLGNQGASAIRAQLQSLKDVLEKTISDPTKPATTPPGPQKTKLTWAVEGYTGSLDPLLAKAELLSSNFEPADKVLVEEYSNRIGSIETALKKFATDYNLNGSYLELDDYKVWKDGLAEAFGKWNTSTQNFSDAKSTFGTALTAYKTYAASHVGLEESVEYQGEIQKLTSAFGTYQQKVSEFQTYSNDLSTRIQHLRYETLDRLQRARTLVDMSTLDLSTRNTLKGQIDTFKGSFSKKDSTGKDIPDDITSLIQSTGTSFNESATAFSEYSNRYTQYRQAIEEKGAALSSMTGLLSQLLESQRTSLTAQKAQLGFLIDEDGTIEDLQKTVESVSLNSKTEAARLDNRVAQILKSKLGNLDSDKSKRKFDPIYLKAADDLNQLYVNFKGSADEILEIKAQQIALSYLKNASLSLTSKFADDEEYSKLQEDLTKTADRTQATQDFYITQKGFLNESDRLAYRMSDDENKRRMASEYYSFGSTFVFGNAVIQATSSQLNLAGVMQSFAQGVKSGAVLSGLRDDYFQDQENKASGLFKELTDAAGIGNYKAIDFYKDSIRTAPGVDELDTAKIATKKAELAALVASFGTPEEKLNALLSSSSVSQFGSIFGTLTGTNVKQDLLSWKNEIESARTLFQNLDTTMLPALTNFSTKFDGLLNFFNTPARAQMQGYSSNLLGLLNGLMNLENSNSPLHESAPDQDGNPVDSVVWTPTYKDVNGKLPWESGYDAANLKVIGYEKSLADLDLTDLNTKKSAFDTELAKWDTQKGAVNAKLVVYRASLKAVTDFIAAHPTDYADFGGGAYLTLIQTLKTDALALTAAHAETVSYITNVSLKFEEFKAEQEYITRQAKQKLGLAVDKILVPAKYVTGGDPSELSNTDPIQKSLKDNILITNPNDFNKIQGTASSIVQALAEFDFGRYREVGQYSSLGSNGIYFYFGNLNQVNGALSSAGATINQNASAWVSAREGKDVPLSTLSSKLASLNDKIVYYKEGAAPNQIGQDALVTVVANLRNFFLEKNLQGSEFNPVLSQIVEAAGAFTDQIENIKYLQANKTISLPQSKANLSVAEEAKATLIEVSKLADEISYLVSATDSSGAPAYTNLAQVQTILSKYEILKTKVLDQSAFEAKYKSSLGDAYWLGAWNSYKASLTSAEYLFQAPTQAKLNELKQNSWEIYKRNISNAYLTQRVGNPVLPEFLNELRAGKFSVLVPNQGVVQIDSKFLGVSLNEAQIQEIGDYLKIPDAKALITRQGVISDLDAFLKDQDPAFAGELRDVALVHSYSELKNGIAQGAVFADRDLPAELKDFALISGFEYFLANTQVEETTGEGATAVTKLVRKYDPKNEASRRNAMSDFLLKLGPVHKKDADGKLVLDTTRQTAIESLTNEYLNNYGTKNPASYLNSQILKDFEGRAAYYAEKELRISKNANSSTPASEKKAELSYQDLTALKDWICEAKYDPSTEAAILEAARMDFLLSKYFGEDTEDLKASDLAKNPELAKFYGTGGKGYFSQMDAYFTDKGVGVLTTAEKDQFRLLSSGVADAWGLWQYDPSSLISKDIYTTNFEYANEFTDLKESLSEESVRIKKEIVSADADVRKARYVNDYKRGLIHFNSYQSYLGIPKGQVASDVTTNEDLAIAGTLRELEANAEAKLGAFFNVLETQKSFVFDNTPLADALPSDAIQTVADLNPGLKATAKFISQNYSLTDNVLSKTADKYEFEAKFADLKSRLDQSLNVVSAGSVDYDKYANEIGRQSGMIQTLQNTITTSGQSFVLLDAALKSGVNVQAELANAKKAFDDANAAIEGPSGLKKQFTDAQNQVNTLQNAYLNAESNVSDAYKAMLAKQDVFNNKAALYDYSILLEYSKHSGIYNGNTDGATENGGEVLPEGYIDTPKKLAKERAEAAAKEFEAKQKETEALKKKMDSQVSLGDLQTYVKKEREEAEKWALLSVKYNTAEIRLRQKIANLKQQVASQKQALDAELDKLWPLPAGKSSAGMMDDLDGSLNFGSDQYKKTEEWNRDRMRMADGLIQGKIGPMDVVAGYLGDYSAGVQNANPAFGLSGYDVGSFYGKWSDKINQGAPSLSRQAYDQMQFVLFGAAPGAYGARVSSPDGGSFGANYFGQAAVVMGVQLMYLTSIDMVCMGLCAFSLAYAGEVAKLSGLNAEVTNSVESIKAQAAALKSKTAELQNLTDVNDTTQLFNILQSSEFGLTAEDIAMIQTKTPSSTSLKDLEWKTSNGAPMSFNDLTGSNGLRLAGQKAIHDAYGNYVRSSADTDASRADAVTRTAAGGVTATGEDSDQYMRQTALMVGADEFLDALGVLANTQYTVARDAYYQKAESFVKETGTGAEKVAVKVESKTVLQEREGFLANLLKKITETTSGETQAKNIETDIYQAVLGDYMGESGVVTQVYGAELGQRGQMQSQQWDLKEKEFYNLKSDWIQNVSYLKETGTKRWDNMVQEFQGKHVQWQKDFKSQHESNQAVYLSRIESAVEKKEAWTQEFLQKSNDQADELSLKEMYDSISGVVSSMQENLPSGVNVNININDILSDILSKKPGSFSSELMDRASHIDTNFFLNQVKKYCFDDSGVKEQFQGMMKQMNVLSQNLIILQTLESLRSMPEGFSTAVKKQNEAAQKSLDNTMAFGGFARMGGMYVRTIKTASGGTEVQSLGTYLDYAYTPPTQFPEVKDSNNVSWNLTDTSKLLDGAQGAPSASDLTVMVKLAKNKMLSDFKLVLNNDKQHNYEAELGLIDPSEAADAMDNFIQGVESGETVSCLGKSAEECAKAAITSGTLVGDVPDGAFGVAQFGQFFAILKTKKEMDKRKAQMDAARNRKKGGMGRFYNQLGTIGEGIGEALKGVGNMMVSSIKAQLKVLTGDINGAKKDIKDMGKAGERALQGTLYAYSGIVDFVLFAAETVLEPVVTIVTGGFGNMQNTGLDGTFAEGNYELRKLQNRNKAQQHLNELGTRTGQEMYANDAVVDKVVSTTLAAIGIVGTILAFTPLSPIGLGMMAVSAVGMAGWKSFRGAYEGGAAGALAGVASAAVNYGLNEISMGAVNVNMSYSYAGGFGVGVNVGGGGFGAGVNYNEKSGFGVSAGIVAGGGSLMYNESFGRGDTRASHGWSASAGNLQVNYDNLQGYSASLKAATAMFGMPNGGGFGVSSSLTWSQKGGLNGSVSYDMLNAENYSKYTKATEQNNAATKNAWNQNMMLGILEGLGIAVTSQEGRKSAWDKIQDDFGATGNFLSGLGSKIGGAYDSVSEFVTGAYQKMFGPKQAYLMVVGRGAIDKPKGFGLNDALPEGYSVSKGNTGWKLSYGDETQTHSEYVQELKNGTVNRINEREVNGERLSYVNGKLLKHGDGMVMDSEGKLQVISKADLSKYIKDNNITNAVVSTNGIANSALDASQMFQSIARHVNQTDASQGGSGAVIHIFRDKKVSYAMSPNLDDITVSSSLTDIINAGAFQTGGTILGHSAGGKTIQNGIMNSDIRVINADVITFGGANNMALNDRVKSWTDVMHKQDLITGKVWANKTYDPSIGNYKMIRTNFQNINDNDWKTHSFLGTYNEEFLQYYNSNSRGY